LRAAVWGVAVGLCLLVGATKAGAQSAVSGALGGVVADASGAAVPAVSVEARDTASGEVRRVDADALGEFLLSDLPPGLYALQMRASGFDVLRVVDVAVAVGKTTRLAPVLHVATQAQMVEVRDADALPEFESPVNADLSPEALRALPLDGRRFQALAVLTPLVSADDAPPADGGAVDSDNVRVAVRGLDPMYNRYLLDGLSGTRAFDGEPRGGRAVPTRSTVLAAVLGVGGLVGALCVLASLDRTTATPNR